MGAPHTPVLLGRTRQEQTVAGQSSMDSVEPVWTLKKAQLMSDVPQTAHIKPLLR